MKQRYIRLFLLQILALFLLTSLCHASPQPFGEMSKDKVIEQYFKDKNIDAIEGIWITTDNQYEFAIIKNTTDTFQEYDYLGIITNTTEKSWDKGEVKLFLKKTALTQTYAGNYRLLEKSGKLWGGSSKKEYGTTFALKSKNLIDCYLPTGLYGLPVKTTFIRIYPNADSHAGTALQTSGTGFFITSSLIATNYHVVADAKEIEITFQNNTKAPAVVAAKDPINDLALLKVTGFEQIAKPASIGQYNDIKEGIQVFAVGFPMAGEMGAHAKIGEGIINGVTGLDDDIRMMQISVPIQPGNSGSPLYNASGQVIGIITSTLNNKYFLNRNGVIPQNVNYAIKITYLNMLLNTLQEDIKPSEPSATILAAPQIMDTAKESVVLITAK